MLERTLSRQHLKPVLALLLVGSLSGFLLGQYLSYSASAASTAARATHARSSGSLATALRTLPDQQQTHAISASSSAYIQPTTHTPQPPGESHHQEKHHDHHGDNQTNGDNGGHGGGD